MSTITKILKTAGVSALCNGVHLYLLKDKYKSIEFTKAEMCAAFTTLPALAGFGIDKLVNQKFTSNKTTQYGLTALESSLIFPVVTAVVTALSGQNKPLKYFTDLFSSSLKGNCGASKLLTASTMVQSLAFKSIWDSSDEMNPELDKQTESLELITEFNSTEELHS